MHVDGHDNDEEESEEDEQAEDEMTIEEFSKYVKDQAEMYQFQEEVI